MKTAHINKDGVKRKIRQWVYANADPIPYFLQTKPAASNPEPTA